MRKVRKFKVLFWISAEDLGTNDPWIPDDSEATLSAERYEVDRYGLLHFFVGDKKVATFFPPIAYVIDLEARS